MRSRCDAQTCKARHRRFSPHLPLRLTQGFAIFWLLAAMVFMATFAGVIALRYQAASSVNQVATDTHHKVTVTADVARLTAPRQAAARPVEQEKESGSGSKARTLLAGLFDDADEPEATGASRTASAPDAQHAAWVDELYVQLNSLEPRRPVRKTPRR